MVLEYRFSSVVSPSRYDSQGLMGDIPLRQSNFADAETVGEIRAQEDWNVLVAPLSEKFHGGLDPNLSFVSVSIPECRPERLEIISYANEFAFIYDDATENIAHDRAEADMAQTLDLFMQGATTGYVDPRGSGKNKIQAQIFNEMAAIDRPRAMVCMQAWAEFLQLTSSRDRKVRFDTLDEYIPYRVWDVGQMLMYGLVTFGMGLTIPEEDKGRATEATVSAFGVIALTNDLFSWERERDAAKRDGMPHVMNAIYVLMGQHNVSEEEAKQMCHEKIVELVQEYKAIVEKYKNDTSSCIDLRKYIEALQCNISGNLIWSLTCPRYNPGTKLNACQTWMRSRVRAHNFKPNKTYPAALPPSPPSSVSN
ncbi:terpenoid synthase [Amniculicola lignicola CBS 123094]|uniref:Terpene synthase n=1 Tax=Amniculicola lignicola CBS 123094 TaxID=1392246 RepID=A0A6A5VWC2_9PLEO|nr:terpenoid synthase [Amniculicola lignicola CBS 123094]